MRNIRYKFRSGFTLTELAIAMTINLMVILIAGGLLVSGNRGWQQTYTSAYKKIRQDALAVTIEFGSIGRKSNRLNYTIYKRNGSSFSPAVPQTSDPEEVVSGDAVEFRYWDVGFDKTDSHNLMDVTKTATAYAFFYVEGTQLKVDHGPYPPGAVAVRGGRRNTNGIVTRVIADNVSTDKAPRAGAFSHTTLNGVGQGSVRINVTLTDPEDDESTKVMTATLMRNIWPR